MRALFAVAALAVAVVSGNCYAEDLTAAKAEELLLPLMPGGCAPYYHEEGDPAFADIDGKYLCVYKPNVTRVVMTGSGATVEYTHARHFDNDLSQAWLNDVAKMETKEALSPLFKQLKTNLLRWRTDSGGVDLSYHPAKATFTLSATGWQVVSPQ